ncbi:MAG TPA: hydroxymethylglutaryl-CoA lyase [Solirubrobacter sp.]|jgi:hydroxymethylglutaryl-CoA lyase|nr:hydroxymethylglutaryl-CoA lyase [Solirubrobacter sp.]
MSLRYPESVEVIEVGPRDGLQSLARVIPTADKLRMIELLADAGFRTIEVTALVRPDVVPQLADADRLLARLPRRDRLAYRALVANRRGAERAVAGGVDEVLGLVSCSETYNRRNQGMSVQRSVEDIRAVFDICRTHDIGFTAGIALAFFCPYEGETPMHRPLAIVDQLVAHGVERLYVAASMGMADPAHVHRLCSAILDRHPRLSLGLHLHDTNGMALANAVAAMDAGVRWFEGSICGIGGGIAMPMSTLDIGNVASEDLVSMLEAMGIHTGVDVAALRDVGWEIAELLDVEPRGRFLRAGTKDDVLRADGALPLRRAADPLAH